MRLVRCAFAALPFVLALATTAEADGIRVARADSAQLSPAILSDGAGGAYLAWEDHRRGWRSTWMQRVGPDGRALGSWPAAGYEALDHPGQTLPVLAGAEGGVYVASGGDGWNFAGHKISANVTRISSEGDPAAGWPEGGVRIHNVSVMAPGADNEEPLGVSGSGDTNHFPNLDVTPGGDLFMAYSYMPYRSDFYLRMARMPTEYPLESPSVALACGQHAIQELASICIVPSGMAYALSSGNAAAYTPRSLVLHRFHSDGALDPAWPACGKAIAVDILRSFSPGLVSDGTGGTYAVWQDLRDPARERPFVLRLDPDGIPASGWSATGVALSNAPTRAARSRPAMGGTFAYTSITNDGAGGVVVAWIDLRAGDGDVYLQRLSQQGTPAPGWPAGGLAVCAARGEQANVSIVSDGAGGAFLAWEDARQGAGRDIYAHHVLANGSFAPGWAADGELIDEHFADQHTPVISAGLNGEPIVAWVDTRHGEPAIYAGRRAALGERTASGSRPGALPLGDALTDGLLIDVQTMPLGVPPGIRLTIGGQGAAQASLHDVTGRELLRREFQPGEHRLVLEGLGFAPGVYFARLTRGEARVTSRVVVWK